MPDDLDVQQGPIQELVPLMGVASVFLKNHEADDLIASYVTEACKEGLECVVATNDKDIFQMVRDGVSIYSTAKADVGEGNGGYKLLGVPEVRAKWGVDPALIADVLALTGDSADNIPGVPGVGGKTAAKWISLYGSLDRILGAADLDPKVREKVEASRDQINQNRQMVALDLDLPLPLPIADMKVEPRYPELIEALRKCEFRTLTAEVEREAAEQLKIGDSSLLINGEGERKSSPCAGASVISNQQSTIALNCGEGRMSEARDQQSEVGSLRSESEAEESRGSKGEDTGKREGVPEAESAISNQQSPIPARAASAVEQGELF
jgi:DNA polymerase-1